MSRLHPNHKGPLPGHLQNTQTLMPIYVRLAVVVGVVIIIDIYYKASHAPGSPPLKSFLPLVTVIATSLWISAAILMVGLLHCILRELNLSRQLKLLGYELTQDPSSQEPPEEA